MSISKPTPLTKPGHSAPASQIAPTSQNVPEIQAAKAALRARFRAERAAVSPEENHCVSQQIMQRVVAHATFRQAATVFLYVSTAGEIETRALLAYALAQGKRVCVPRCEPRPVQSAPTGLAPTKSALVVSASAPTGSELPFMTARLIQSLEELGAGAYGIPEPSGEAPLVPPEQIDLVLAPALACDKQGRRLGYGGGYYDRFLCQTPAVCAALCPEARLVEALPCEPYDVPCSLLFTERRVLRTDET